jgi:hypothetical protein
MKTLITLNLFITFCFLGNVLSAQRNVTWIGGTPGQESNWFCYKNWSNANVPDEFTNVYIIDVSSSTFHYPVIKSKEATVLSISIVSEGKLTIEKTGSLSVIDTIILKNNKSIINSGKLNVESQGLKSEYVFETLPLHK